jgi:hypothetical protein
VEFVRLCIHVTQHELFDDPCERADDERHDRERGPEIRRPLQRLIAQVRAEQIERTVREIHEAQQAEHDRQAHRQQEVQHAHADAVDDLQQIDVHGFRIGKEEERWSARSGRERGRRVTRACSRSCRRAGTTARS